MLHHYINFHVLITNLISDQTSEHKLVRSRGRSTASSVGSNLDRNLVLPGERLNNKQ